MKRFTGIVVAGGQGTRLGGQDKAFLEVNGEAIIARTLRIFANLFPQTVVVTQHPERFAHFSVDVTVDRYTGKGPLAGIHAGLIAAREPHVFVAACDMPLLDAGVIRFLLERASCGTGTPGPDAVIPWWDGDVEPLHAVYASRCLPVAEQCLERDERSIRSFLTRIRVDYVAEEVLAKLPGATRSFANINTPGELERIRTGGSLGPGASSDPPASAPRRRMASSDGTA